MECFVNEKKKEGVGVIEKINKNDNEVKIKEKGRKESLGEMKRKENVRERKSWKKIKQREMRRIKNI